MTRPSLVSILLFSNGVTYDANILNNTERSASRIWGLDSYVLVTNTVWAIAKHWDKQNEKAWKCSRNKTCALESLGIYIYIKKTKLLYTVLSPAPWLLICEFQSQYVYILEHRRGWVYHFHLIKPVGERKLRDEATKTEWMRVKILFGKESPFPYPHARFCVFLMPSHHTIHRSPHLSRDLNWEEVESL